MTGDFKNHRTNEPPQMKYFSCFSGIEAATLAWKPLGWEAVGFSEIEPFPCAVLSHHYPNIKNYGDITKHTEWGIAPGSVDIIVAGSPCQAFSVAGLRKGLEDPRGNLALVLLGLVDRVRPKWLVWENVPGVLSSNGGRDFSSFLGALSQLGYGWAYRVLDAQHFGVPQRRRRVFLVATNTGQWEAAAEVLSLGEGLRGYLETGGKKGKETAGNVEDGAPGESVGGCWWDGSQVSQTIDAVVSKGQTMPEKNRFPAVLEPFRKAKRAQSEMDHETWVADGKANTINVFDSGDTRTTHAVVQPIAIQATIIGRGENAGPQGVGAKEGGPMFTLTKADIHGVAHSDSSLIENKMEPGDLPMAVRRLTPEECEALQGFPKGFTKIPWKNKTIEDCPDGPRYKACGNSMAVPVMAWIGKRISEYEASKNAQA